MCELVKISRQFAANPLDDEPSVPSLRNYSPVYVFPIGMGYFIHLEPVRKQTHNTSYHYQHTGVATQPYHNVVDGKPLLACRSPCSSSSYGKQCCGWKCVGKSTFSPTSTNSPAVLHWGRNILAIWGRQLCVCVCSTN